MKNVYSAQKGFSLIELLTVIAIIAILAALLFPVFNRVREQHHQTACITQMHDVVVALKLYYEDNHKYPVALLGLAEKADGTYYTGTGVAVPIGQMPYKPLTTGQNYLKTKEIFLCPDSNVKDPALVTSVVYPAGVPPTGQVRFTPRMQHNDGSTRIPNSLLNQPVYYYGYDSYDVGPRVDRNGNPQPGVELHYSIDWTGTGTTDPVIPDDPHNQLKYGDGASDKTVVTWCTYHAALAHASVIPVIMLSGTVKSAPIGEFVSKGPLNFSF